MGDCSNVEMRELLPEYLHDRLSAAERGQVAAHLDVCADCRAELAFIERAHRSVSARVPVIDASRVASRLPLYRATSAWWRRPSTLAIAAGLLVVVGGSTWFWQRNDVYVGSRPVWPPTAQVPNSVVVVPAEVASRGASTAVANRSAKGSNLAVSETLTDLSDKELRTLLEELGKFEALTSSETDVIAGPSVGRRGGT